MTFAPVLCNRKPVPSKSFIIDPVAVMRMTSNPEVAAVAQEVRTRLQRVRGALTATAST